MDKIATLPVEDREYLFTETAGRIGTILPIIIEKDFWVVWTLKHLFSLDIAKYLCFRGGTSLSKVYGVIQRFSEDIDLGIDRSLFNFDDKRDLYSCKTSSQEEKALKKLNKSTRIFLKTNLHHY